LPGVGSIGIVRGTRGSRRTNIASTAAVFRESSS